MVYAAARRCICRARVSSAGSSLFIRNWRMGCAHEGAAISSTATTATWSRPARRGGGGLAGLHVIAYDAPPRALVDGVEHFLPATLAAAALAVALLLASRLVR